MHLKVKGFGFLIIRNERLFLKVREIVKFATRIAHY